MMSKRESVLDSISLTPRETTSSQGNTNRIADRYNKRVGIKVYNSPLKSKSPKLNLDFLKASNLNEKHSRLISKFKLENK